MADKSWGHYLQPYNFKAYWVAKAEECEWIGCLFQAAQARAPQRDLFWRYSDKQSKSGFEKIWWLRNWDTSRQYTGLVESPWKIDGSAKKTGSMYTQRSGIYGSGQCGRRSFGTHLRVYESKTKMLGQSCGYIGHETPETGCSGDDISPPRGFLCFKKIFRR